MIESEKLKAKKPDNKKVRFSDNVRTKFYNYKKVHVEGDTGADEGIYEHEDKKITKKSVQDNCLQNYIVRYLVEHKGKEDEEADRIVEEAFENQEEESLVVEYLEHSERKKSKANNVKGDNASENLERETVENLVKQQGKTYEEAEKIAKQLLENTKVQTTQHAESQNQGFWEKMYLKEQDDKDKEDSCPCRIM